MSDRQCVALEREPQSIQTKNPMDLDWIGRAVVSPSTIIHTRVIQSWRDAISVIPPPGQQSVCVVKGHLSAWEWVPVLLHAGVCDRLILTTYNLAVPVAQALQGLVSLGRILLADVIVSEAMHRLSSGPETLQVLMDTTRIFPGRVRVMTTDIHAKLICMAMESGDAYVIEGSGNMARNTHIELYSLHNDPARLQFHSNWTGALLHELS